MNEHGPDIQISALSAAAADPTGTARNEVERCSVCLDDIYPLEEPTLTARLVCNRRQKVDIQSSKSIAVATAASASASADVHTRATRTSADVGVFACPHMYHVDCIRRWACQVRYVCAVEVLVACVCVVRQVP